MLDEKIRIEDLQRISNLVRELDQRISEAMRVSQEVGLTQAARVLETIKSYIELLRRELEVEH